MRKVDGTKWACENCDRYFYDRQGAWTHMNAYDHSVTNIPDPEDKDDRPWQEAVIEAVRRRPSPADR